MFAPSFDVDLRDIVNGESLHPYPYFIYPREPFGSLYMMFEAFGFMQERTLQCRNLSQLPSGELLWQYPPALTDSFLHLCGLV